MRTMISEWKIKRQEKVDGKWKDRKIDQVLNELVTAVCDAARQWEPSVMQSGAATRGVSHHSAGASEDAGSSSSISLDTAIQKMTEHSILDDRGKEILEAIQDC